MAGEETPREFSIDEKVGWSTLTIQKGEVVEIYIPRSNLTIQVDEWCAFVVLGTYTQTDGSLVAEVHFLGCGDGEVSKLLEEEVNGRGRRGLLHFCPAQPCTEVVGDPFTIHVLQARVCALEEFVAPFMDSKLRTRARQWLRREKGEEVEEPPLPEDPKRTGLKRPAGSQPGRSRRPAKPNPKKPPRKDATAEGKKMNAAMKEKLRGRLEEVKRRAALTKVGVEDVEASSDGPTPTTPDSDQEASDYVEDETPTTGTKLVAHPPSLALALAEGGKSKGKSKKKEKKAGKKKDKKKREKPPVTEAPVEVGAIRDITSKDLRGQLVRRAVIADQLKSKETKRRRGKKDVTKRLCEALTDVLSPKDSKKRKEDKKKKKRKRRIRADGVIESLSSSSPESSEEYEDETDSSLEELETPMKQKSKERPGSILKMLTQHVQEQLEQAATTEVEAGQSSLIGGVKVLTYFALQIKPSFPTQMREMREMYHLANVMDSLRRGEIAKVGDALAARFMAIHQSLLDQNWSTARFMEIFPLEESSAASSSMVLATRKHTKLVAKMQGIPTWPVGYKGRGRSGKGSWYQPSDHKGEGKDGKSKGKKGKGKGKGRGDGWNSQVNEWKDNKEKPEDK